MKKQIKKYGNTNIVSFTKEDMKVYELKTGDVVEVHLLKVKK